MGGGSMRMHRRDTRGLKNSLLQNLVFPGVQPVRLLFGIGRRPGAGTPPERDALP